ncbi:Holliday junction ATP-dependent DNA helicase RuvB, partial [hydrothermal vent metagenome]
KGFVQRTPRGRMLTGAAFKHLNLIVPQGFIGNQAGAQAGLFDEEGEN